MQQLSALDRKLAAILAKERRAGRHLPYAAHLDPRTILLRDGRLMQALEFAGIDFETATTEILNSRKRQREAAFGALGSHRFGLYHHVIRHKIAANLDGEFPDRFCAELDRDWFASLETRELYQNRLYIAVILRRPVNENRLAAQLIRPARGRESLANDIELLTSTVDALRVSLMSYRPEILTTYRHAFGLGSRILEYLALLLEGRDRRVGVPQADLGYFLPSRRISFGANTVEIGDRSDAENRFLAMLAIKEYPATTSPGLLDEVLRLPIEMVISQGFGVVDRQSSVNRIAQVLRRLRSADDAALSLQAELIEAQDSVASGRSAFGQHHLCVALRGSSEHALNDSVADVRALFNDAGIVVVREDLALEATFWSQFPGNFHYASRRALISNKNFAGLASMHNFPDRSAETRHWQTPITVFETTASGAYHFDFHSGDLGNFTIIGPSGSGKTVLLNFLLAQSRRLSPRIVLFDKDRGSEPFIDAIGGNYNSLAMGAKTTFNPLGLENTAQNRAFLVEFICTLVRRPGDALSPAERGQLHRAVEANMAAPSHARQLRYFAQLLRGHSRPHDDDLYARLARWWGEGEFAWAFDNQSERLKLGEAVIGFDTTDILDRPELRTPIMMYLFHRIEQRLDGTPTIIVVDEGWKALDDEVFSRQIRDWEKTIRKRNGIVGFVTQNADDALESQIASAIVEQSATQIFLPNPIASVDSYVEGFGLSLHELNLVRSLPIQSRAFLVKQHGHSTIARLDLASHPHALEILAGHKRAPMSSDEDHKPHPAVSANWLNTETDHAQLGPEQ